MVARSYYAAISRSTSQKRQYKVMRRVLCSSTPRDGLAWGELANGISFQLSLIDGF